ncbi:MAG: UvrD-helicase domain-containing protein [Gaiellales bacterium]
MTLIPLEPEPETAAPASHRWTAAQQAAIAARRRTLVTAAAGSGKTSVLTELVAQALAARELAPAQVCAVTFTEKAAQEMRERIAARLNELGERDLLAELELARIGTIHSLCAAILRTHGAAVGVDPAVGQLDESQAAWIIRASYEHAIEQHADGDEIEDQDVHWLRARMGDERLEELLRGVHRHAIQGDGTARLRAPADVSAVLDQKTNEALVTGPDARRILAALDVLWRRFRQSIEQRKRTLGRISFDDLERLAVEAARLPDVRADLRARWSMLLVDEFQDTNARQYELLDAIGGDRLFMVGDEWQSIYRFRGADVQVFRQRRDDPTGGDVVPMRENFRSDAPVLDVVNLVFGHEALFGERYEPVNPGTDRQRHAPAPAVELLVAPTKDLEDPTAADGLAPREHEAMRVAERIAQLIEQGEAAPGDIAVLYARGTGIDLYEQALRRWGLPVLRGASNGYYDQRDVRDVLALLACLRNRADDFAAAAVLAGPIGSLEWHQLAELKAEAKAQRTSLLAAAEGSQATGVRRVKTLLAQLDERAAQGSLVELVAQVVAAPELELGAAREVDGLARVANLRRLIELAASAEQIGVRDVAGFLEFVEAQRRDARIGEASIADEASGAVRLMTIHASKGLEFPHVFVVEAGSGSSGSGGLVPSSLRDADGIVHVPLPKRDGRCERTHELSELTDADAAAAREESLRLWYVAMTRAQHRLYVTGRYDFTPTTKGAARSMSGALSWLASALDLEPWFGGVSRSYLACDDLVRIDTRAASEQPRLIWIDETRSVNLAQPLMLPPAASSSTLAEPEIDPMALQGALRDSVSSARSDEWRQLAGTRIHDAVARLLDAAGAGTPISDLLDPDRGPWLTDTVRERLIPVVDSDVFQQLIALHGRSEVPYVAGRGATVASRAVPGAEIAASAAQVDAGRIDALARLADGSWWVVDWKSTLPTDPEAAWQQHGEQLTRYAETAIAAGAPGAIVTLVALDRPADAVSWELTGEDGASAPLVARLASIPASG